MIPKIIHQIWDGKKKALSAFFLELSETWKENHSSWKYEFWDHDRMDKFVLIYYPDFYDMYHNYKYDVQRWDIVRYMILSQIGGLYIDFDYECIEPVDAYLINKSCCFGLDPSEHATIFNKDYIISNAFIASVPNHGFMVKILDTLKNCWPEIHDVDVKDPFEYVLETTGPYYISKLYESYENKKDVYLFPAHITSPLSKNEINNFIMGSMNKETAEEKLKDAIAIHYFNGSWY